jgi:hypothetical protein
VRLGRFAPQKCPATADPRGHFPSPGANRSSVNLPRQGLTKGSQDAAPRDDGPVRERNPATTPPAGRWRRHGRRSVMDTKKRALGCSSPPSRLRWSPPRQQPTHPTQPQVDEGRTCQPVHHVPNQPTRAQGAGRPADDTGDGGGRDDRRLTAWETVATRAGRPRPRPTACHADARRLARQGGRGWDLGLAAPYPTSPAADRTGASDTKACPSIPASIGASFPMATSPVGSGPPYRASHNTRTGGRGRLRCRTFGSFG